MTGPALARPSWLALASGRLWRVEAEWSATWTSPAERLLSLAVWLAALAFVIQGVTHLAVFDTSIEMVNADEEQNLWSWASSSATFAAAVGALVLLCLRPSLRVQLGVLAAGLLFFSTDDAVALHERLIGDHLDSIGPLDEGARYLWPLIYLPILATAFVLLWTLAAIVPSLAGRVLRAGGLLLTAGIVLELLGGAIVEAGVGKSSFLYNLEVALEEGCELAAWILVAAALFAIALSWAAAGRLETPAASGVIPVNGGAEKEVKIRA